MGTQKVKRKIKSGTKYTDFTFSLDYLLLGFE